MFNNQEVSAPMTLNEILARCLPDGNPPQLMFNREGFSDVSLVIMPNYSGGWDVARENARDDPSVRPIYIGVSRDGNPRGSGDCFGATVQQMETLRDYLTALVDYLRR
jgi:hypothetical protein